MFANLKEKRTLFRFILSYQFVLFGGLKESEESVVDSLHSYN